MYCMIVYFFTLSVVFLMIAHFVRFYRWQLFINIYEKPNLKRLLQSLIISYFINLFLPLKLGDLFRAWYAGKKMKNGFILSFSTVIVDRCLDVICVGIIFLLFYLTESNTYYEFESILTYMVSSFVLIVCGIFVYLAKSLVKKIILNISNIFNSNTELKILELSWVLIINFKNSLIRISKVKLIMSTIIMWFFYLLSYFCFFKFLCVEGSLISFVDVFDIFFEKSKVIDGTIFLPFANHELIKVSPYVMIAYIVLPLIITYLISFLFKNDSFFIKSTDKFLNLMPHMDRGERLKFLELYFSSINNEFVRNYLRINESVLILRDFSAGSNATTLLCMDQNKTFFRKYAFGDDGRKLYQQIEWIENNKDKIPLPSIIKQEANSFYCYYDMPFNNATVGLFEYIHSMPLRDSWSLIRCVLDRLERSLYSINSVSADKETINKYIDLKVLMNLKKIKECKLIREILNYDEIIINGVPFKNLNYFDKYLNKDFLYEVFKNDFYSVIHGDLTVENIICIKQENHDAYYIIDPNTGNIHNSPNLDFAKLLQSIHGGYEFLMKTKDVTLRKNELNFSSVYSYAYFEIHKKLKDYMLTNFGFERTRSIYFHEIVHWLRLMPYKIEKNGIRMLLFYAGMLKVMNDVERTFCHEGEKI